MNKIGKVNCVVTSSFLPPKEKVGLKDRLARVITSDFIIHYSLRKSVLMNDEY